MFRLVFEFCSSRDGLCTPIRPFMHSYHEPAPPISRSRGIRVWGIWSVKALERTVTWKGSGLPGICLRISMGGCQALDKTVCHQTLWNERSQTFQSRQATRYNYQHFFIESQVIVTKRNEEIAEMSISVEIFMLVHSSSRRR
jgi:hypothetical protein